MRTMKLNIKSDEGIIILGKRGSGKTTLARYLISTFNFSIFIFDVIGNYRDFKDKANYLLLNPRSEAPNLYFQKILENGNTFVILDEADRYEYSPELSDLINLGRNFNIGYLAIARRTANIHKDFLSNSNYSFIFHHSQENDIAHIIRSYAVNPEEITSLKQYEFLVFQNDDILFKGKLDLTKGIVKTQ